MTAVLVPAARCGDCGHEAVPDALGLLHEPGCGYDHHKWLGLYPRLDAGPMAAATLSPPKRRGRDPFGRPARPPRCGDCGGPR